MNRSVLESILSGENIRETLLKEANDTLMIQPGDTIKVGAEKAVVKDILFQDVFLGNDHQMATADVEFKDDAGNYRHWQSWSDGGTLTTVDGATYKFVKESKTLTEGANPCGGDKKHYFLFYVDNYGSYPQNTKESIAQFGKDHLAALKDLDLKTIEDSHMYWGTEGSGFAGMYNGDTYVLFDDVDNLPAEFKEDALKYCKVSPKVNESSEDVYHCDACGEEIPFDSTNWFTSSIGFCDKCWDRLHKNVDKVALANLYDASSSGDDRAALKVIRLAQESKLREGAGDWDMSKPGKPSFKDRVLDAVYDEYPYGIKIKDVRETPDYIEVSFYVDDGKGEAFVTNRYYPDGTASGDYDII